MKIPHIFCITLISLSCFGIEQNPAHAACENYEAVGWFRNETTGERSEDIVGTSWSCGNAYSLGAGFRSTTYSVSTSLCAFDCPEGRNPNQTYITIKKQKENISEFKTGEIVNSKSTFTAKDSNQNITYSWKSGKYLPCYPNKKVPGSRRSCIISSL